jgi:nucleotide-binding universal stress UspA family protein
VPRARADDVFMTDARELIIVGFDGSTHAVAAARWAFEEAGRRHADVELLSCFHVPYLAEGGGLSGAYVSPDELIDESKSVLDAALADMTAERDAAERAGANVDLRLVDGAPGPTLVNESKGATMLVVGRRGHGALARLLLGSVSRYVAIHAVCPVVVIGLPEE